MTLKGSKVGRPNQNFERFGECTLCEGYGLIAALAKPIGPVVETHFF
jgi:hypothetical protein